MVTPTCPRCNSPITVTPDASGFVLCSACGARLRRTAPASTNFPGSQGVPAEPAHPKALAAPAPSELADGALPDLAAEIQSLRRGQQEILAAFNEILALVRSGGLRDANALRPAGHELPEGFLEAGEASAPSALPVRTRSRRKTVLIIDDDDTTRNAAQAAFEQAHIPVRGVGDGRAALADIAAQRPDVIVLELGLKDPMAGQDVISLIKATMEWVDIPIVLYTRLPIESEKEARTLHGADDLVPKGPAAAEALVARVIQNFQRED